MLFRSPKPQAWAYRDVIRKYGNPEDPVNTLQITLDKQNIVPGQTLTASFMFRNIGRHAIEVKTDCVLPEGLRPADEKQAVFTLQPQETYRLDRRILADKELRPGYYHIFEKAALSNGLFFGWGILACTRQPTLELEGAVSSEVVYRPHRESLNAFDLSAVDAVIFGKEAPALEVDWALYIYESLRSAAGADIDRFSDTDPEARELLKRGNLILVGSPKSNRFVATLVQTGGLDLALPKDNFGLVQIAENPYSEGRKLLLISGDTPEAIQKAASDFLFRYWRHAKDALTFRVGMHSEYYQLQKSTPPQSEENEFLQLSVPETVQAGQRVRILVYRTSEPPEPAAGEPVWSVFDGVETFLGETNATGELYYAFKKPGRYTIRIDKTVRQAATLTVE